VVAPPAGRSWPPLPDWGAAVADAAQHWREASGRPNAALPPLVASCWNTLTHLRDVPLSSVRGGAPWELCEALLTLHAAADEACAGVARGGTADEPFDRLAWRSLQERGSLARLSPARVTVVPKTHFSTRGITIRSLSRYLALSYEPMDLRWRSTQSERTSARREYNLVLVPWPLTIAAEDFRPARSTRLENMDLGHFGFFEFVPEQSLDPQLGGEILELARSRVDTVDAVVFPEAALRADEVEPLEQVLAEHGATFLIAGVREHGTGTTFGRNYLHFGVRSDTGWARYEQDKHHRWCLDEAQIRQYHLTRSLDPGKLWWEAISICERAQHVIDVGAGMTTVPLVCEDLARLDEVADVVRRLGPSLVIALLLDGPQLASRWPCRYASVIADDPGSSVLTLTSYGMVARSRPPRKACSRVVAHWTSRVDGVAEIELAPRAAAVLISASVEGQTLWTADGRRHRDVPSLRLSAVQQLRV
jgi:hypothetical protein